MPRSIAQVQNQNLGLPSKLGKKASEYEELSEFGSVFEQFAVKFMETLSKFANERKVVASGNMLKKAKYRFSDDGSVLQIMMPYYFDFPNEGVQGVKSSENASGSPYKYKNYGMNAEGRKAIAKYIKKGYAKIKTVQRKNDVALGIGFEKKNISKAEAQVNTLIYLIKAFGIKKTDYFTDAFNETFKDFGQKISEAMGRDIIISLNKLNYGSNN